MEGLLGGKGGCLILSTAATSRTSCRSREKMGLGRKTPYPLNMENYSRTTPTHLRCSQTKVTLTSPAPTETWESGEHGSAPPPSTPGAPFARAIPMRVPAPPSAAVCVAVRFPFRAGVVTTPPPPPPPPPPSPAAWVSVAPLSSGPPTCSPPPPSPPTPQPPTPDASGPPDVAPGVS